MLETYGPSQAINNAFGLGPGWAFASERDAIARAARTLADALPARGAHHAGNDRRQVGAARRVQRPDRAEPELDPRRRHLLRGDGRRPRPPDPRLGAGGRARAATARRPRSAGPGRAGPAAAGPPVVTAWGGAAPARGPVGARGLRVPARPAGRRRPAAYGDAGPRRVRGAAGSAAASRSPRRRAPTPSPRPPGPCAARPPAEREEGIAFWVETAGGRPARLRPPGGLRARGRRGGARSPPGSRSASSAGALRVAWERGGRRLDPFPLLEATRPPS